MSKLLLFLLILITRGLLFFRLFIRGLLLTILLLLLLLVTGRLLRALETQGLDGAWMFPTLAVGMETALLATAGIVGILILLEQDLIERATTIVLYLLIGFTFSQARRLLVIERERSAALREAGALDADWRRRQRSAG